MMAKNQNELVEPQEQSTMDTHGVTVSEVCGSEAVCTGAVSLRPCTHVSYSSRFNLSSVL